MLDVTDNMQPGFSKGPFLIKIPGGHTYEYYIENASEMNRKYFNENSKTSQQPK